MTFIMESLIGIAGTIAFGLSLYLAYGISEEFHDDSELAATKMFLDKSLVNSLKLISVTGILFGITGVLSIYGIRNDIEILAQSIRLGTILLFASYAYLFVASYRALQKET